MDDKKNEFVTIKIGTVGKSVNGFVFPKGVMERN